MSFKESVQLCSHICDLIKYKYSKPTLDPGCLEAIAIVRRAAGPRAVVPPSDNLKPEENKKIRYHAI